MQNQSNKTLSLSTKEDLSSDGAKGQPCASAHRVEDKDFNNVIGLLNALARQLELNLQESEADYQIISEYCLDTFTCMQQGSQPSAGNSPTQVLQSLQYYDRSTQRVNHVLESLRHLADNMLIESWQAIDMDLEAEVNKTNTFFTECQTRELHSIAAGIGNESDANAARKSEQSPMAKRISQDDDNSGDMELF